MTEEGLYLDCSLVLVSIGGIIDHIASVAALDKYYCDGTVL